MSHPPLLGDLTLTVTFTRSSSPHLWAATTAAFPGIEGSGMTPGEALRSLLDSLVLIALREHPAVAAERNGETGA
jgi:hypothetical protein